MFSEKADFMDVDQSKYYDGSSLIDAPWFVCGNDRVYFIYGGENYAAADCIDNCDLEVTAYVPDRITDPDAVY